jgi:hypothetical protein
MNEAMNLHDRLTALVRERRAIGQPLFRAPDVETALTLIRRRREISDEIEAISAVINDQNQRAHEKQRRENAERRTEYISGLRQEIRELDARLETTKDGNARAQLWRKRDAVYGDLSTACLNP